MVMDHTSRLLLDLYHSARELPIREFKERALVLLKSVCPFNAATWGVGRVQTDVGLAFQSVDLHNLPDDFLIEYEAIADHDLIAFEAFSPRRLGRTSTFNLRELMPGRRYDDIAAFDRRWGLQNLLFCGARDEEAGDAFAALGLWRAKESDRYSEDERRALGALLPHFLEAGTINRLLWLNRPNGTAPPRRGARAIAGERGVLESGDSAFLDVLRSEWPDWSPPVLPGTLVAALGQSLERRFVGKRIIATATLAHGMLFLIARVKGAVEDLTPAQRGVATRIANGLSYKQIARELGLSPATVRNELHSVYGRLGIANKAALARLITESE